MKSGINAWFRLELCLFLVLACGLAAGQRANAEDAAAPTPEQIKGWITGLGAEEFTVREKSETSLRAAGPVSVESLNTALAASSDPEVSVRIRRLLKELGKSHLVESILKDLESTKPDVLMSTVDNLWENSGDTRIRTRIATMSTEPKSFRQEFAAILKTSLDEKKQHDDELQKYQRKVARNNVEVLQVVSTQIAEMNQKIKGAMQEKLAALVKRKDEPAKTDEVEKK